MSEPVKWHGWLLVCLWISHIIILAQPVTGIFVNVTQWVVGILHLSRITLLESIAYIICSILEWSEISAFREKRLSALYYLSSQVFKSCFYTWLLYSGIVLYDSYYPPDWLVILILLAQTVAFYVSLLYAMSMFYQYRMPKRGSFAIYASRRLRDEDINDDISTAISSPTRLNSSEHTRADTMYIMTLASWINSSSYQANVLRPSLEPFYEWMAYTCRALICYIPMLVSLPFHKRLPGEPKKPLAVSENSSLEDWDYPKPTTGDSCRMVAEVRFVEGSNSRDEELAMRTVRLNHLQPTEIPRLEPSATSRSTQQTSTRLLGPRYLCFLTEQQSSGVNLGYNVYKVDDWLAQNKNAAYPSYLFISYTRRQFFTQTDFDPETARQMLRHLEATADRDKALLTNQALIAARQANVPAFWVDFECVKDDEETHKGNMEDVYRICDIVRSCHSLAIVLGPSLNQELQHEAREDFDKAKWLHEWGKRMWTVPEALLCPSEHRIAIYNTESAEVESIAKRNLAGRVWDDADSLRQLIDHYESSLHLTQLELISIALEALHRRQTEVKNAGDVAYALMGLLRLRPKVNKADTDFQAFARLSLANDSDKILERIISLHNAATDSVWHDMQDSWNTKLWHIDPCFQIADVNDGNALVIGDASGTSIDWDSLKPIDFNSNEGIPSGYWVFIRSSPISSLAYVVVWAWMRWILFPMIQTPDTAREKVMFWIMIIPTLCYMTIALIIPFKLAEHFRSPFANTQARMFGLQGKADLSKAEAYIFGSSSGRLRWMNDVHDIDSKPDNRPDFTLIDTLTCTATYFRAENAPTMAFIGAREGGLLRILLCSYDQMTNKFVKETVIRMNTVISQRMPRLTRFRFAMAPSSFKDDPTSRNKMELERTDIPDIPVFISLDDT